MQTFTIEPGGIYHDGDLVLGLGLTFAALAQARRSGELRFTRKGRRVLYRGDWLIEWIERNPAHQGGGSTDDK